MLRVSLRPAERPDGTLLPHMLLTPALAECILEYLPVSLRLPGTVEWVMRYSPKAHGVSLSTLYRNMADREKTVIIVLDSEARIFGGFAPACWRPTQKFYGSGEAFVFAFDAPAGADGHAEGGVAGEPEMRAYAWTSTNSFFMYSDSHLFAMGGGDGKHAFAVRSDLLRGLSSPTETFGNPTLASSEEFVVRDFEMWSLEEI